jgi:hypothetical protein
MHENRNILRLYTGRNDATYLLNGYAGRRFTHHGMMGPQGSIIPGEQAQSQAVKKCPDVGEAQVRPWEAYMHTPTRRAQR